MDIQLVAEKVSIHTLHELEARRSISGLGSTRSNTFPFIRFTNWKQEDTDPSDLSRYSVSIHTLHELEASVLMTAALCTSA